MSIKNLKQTGEDNEGVYNVMDGLSFARALNNNKEELGTSTQVDLDVHNTPAALKNAFREQTGKIGYHTPGGPDDIFTHEEEGTPVNSPSELKDGLAQIYNKAVNNSIDHIETLTLPTKLTYVEGEELDLTGMTVIAVEEDGDTVEVTDYTVDIAGRPLTTEDTLATVSYAGKSTSFTITVEEGNPVITFYNPISLAGGSYVDTDVEDVRALIEQTQQTGDFINVTLKQIDNSNTYDAVLLANSLISCTVSIDGDEENNHMTIYISLNSETGDESVEVSDIVGFENFSYTA